MNNMTATEVRIRQEYANKMFLPELWSSEIMASMKEALYPWPKRSPGEQLLRNAALGYDETKRDTTTLYRYSQEVDNK